jgi:putative transcription factor
MCGNEGNIKPAMVEGVQMQLCPSCMQFGKEVKETPQARARRFGARQERKEPELAIVGDYARRIKAAVDKTGKKHEDVAKELNIKDSLLSHFTTGKRKPSIETARKLEKRFGIKLVFELHEETSSLPTSSLEQDAGCTLGDMIKKRK